MQLGVSPGAILVDRLTNRSFPLANPMLQGVPSSGTVDARMAWRGFEENVDENHAFGNKG
jgi:hypothetical protein